MEQSQCDHAKDHLWNKFEEEEVNQKKMNQKFAKTQYQPHSLVVVKKLDNELLKLMLNHGPLRHLNEAKEKMEQTY